MSEVATSPYTLPWHVPALGDEEIAEIVDTLRSGWLTSGPRTAAFEGVVQSITGAEAAFAVTSCTAALHLALLAAGVGPGDEVITTGFTFCATVNVIVQVGAVPVFVDVQPDTLNIDPRRIAEAVTARTKAIIPVHFAGHPCDMDEISAIAERYGLAVIEDAAHAIGAAYRGRPVGSFGTLAAFSFYANKTVTTGEGGVLVGPKDLVERARLIGRHGIDRPVWQRQGGRSAAYDVVYPGYKYNMSDVHAAIGIHQMRRLDGFIARRAELAAIYHERLASFDGIVVPTTRDHVRHSWHLYAIRFEVRRCPGARDSVATSLKEHGVGTSVHFQAVQRHSFYRDFDDPERFPLTYAAADEILSLPCYPGMTDADVHHVADLLGGIVDRLLR